MILIALGGNLPSERFGPPRQTCEAALSAMGAAGIRVMARSSWYLTTPVPASDQPLFVNGVVRVETNLSPTALMVDLHRIEADFGRRRLHRDEARVIDLDLIDFDGRVEVGGTGPILPHPRMHERAFVLVPLSEVAPRWRHPLSGKSVAELLARLPDDQKVDPLPEAGA